MTKTTDRLTAVFYLLVRDHIPAGVLARMPVKTEETCDPE